MPSLNESHPVIDTQERSLIVSLVVFNNPCFIESHEDNLFATGGVTDCMLSVFEQE